MTQYAKKTCNSCGIKLPKNEMYRVEKEVYVGSSNTGLTKRAVFGTIVGNKKSTRQVGKYLFSPSKRTYKRKREVWMCGDCAGHNSSSTNHPVVEMIFNTIAIILGIAIVVLFVL